MNAYQAFIPLPRGTLFNSPPLEGCRGGFVSDKKRAGCPRSHRGLARLNVSVCWQLSLRFLFAVFFLSFLAREDVFSQSSFFYDEGLNQLAKKQYDQAEKNFLEALKDPHVPVEVYYQLAWVYVAKGKWKMAEDSVSRFLVARPGSADGLYIRGYALFRLGKYEGAIAALQKSLGIKSNNADAHKILGLCFFQKNENELAERELATAAQLDPRSAETQYFLGRYNYSVDRFDRAQQSFQAAIKLDPEYMKAYDNLGLTLDALGQPDAAQKAFHKAIELNERYRLKSAWPYENLGELLLKQNEVTESISYFEKALLIHPGWPKGHVSLGKAQVRIGKNEEAKTNFLAAIRADPEYGDAHYQLGQLYRKLGQKEEALRELEIFQNLKVKTVPIE